MASVGEKRSLDTGNLKDSQKRRRKDCSENPLSFFLHEKMSQSEFLSTYWTKDLLHLKLGNGAFSDVLNACKLESFWELIEERGKIMNFLWTMECNKVVDGAKVKTSPEDGEVKVEMVKELYESGSTIQFHHPHHFIAELANKLSELEDFFGSNVGSNLYITPPKCQGLAPHYDTVDVFVCQVEGSKTWRLHRGGKIDDHPIEDSGDLPMDEDVIGPMVKEVLLEEGDFLYLPRGTVHYATATEKGSVHVTISTCLDNHYGSLLGRVLSDAVTEAAKHHAILRKNGPIDLLQNFGEFVKKEGKEKKRAELCSQINEHMIPLLEPYLLNALDNVVDEYAVEFISDRLPPKNMIKQKMEEEDNDEQPEAPKVVDMKPLEDGKAVIETLVFGPKHMRVVSSELVSDDQDIQFTMMDDSEDSDDDPDTVDNKAEPSSGIEKMNGKTAGTIKKDKGKNEKDEDEEYYYLVDCGSSIIQTHMVDNFRGQNGSTLTKFPKKMKPVVDRLFFSEYRLHELSELEKLGFEKEDLKQELLNFSIKGLIKF